MAVAQENKFESKPLSTVHEQIKILSLPALLRAFLPPDHGNDVREHLFCSQLLGAVRSLSMMRVRPSSDLCGTNPSCSKPELDPLPSEIPFPLEREIGDGRHQPCDTLQSFCSSDSKLSPISKRHFDARSLTRASTSAFFPFLVSNSMTSSSLQLGILIRCIHSVL